MKKFERNRRDREFSLLIRSRGKCERCGNTQTLQTAHVFSRRFLRIRWNPDNAFCFCCRCHWWAHDNPPFFTEFAKTRLGPKRYQDLLDERNNLSKLEV